MAEEELCLKGSKLGREQRDEELAYYFANQAAGSSAVAVRMFCRAHDMPIPEGIHYHAHALFKKPHMKLLIEKYREANRIEMETIRDDNIAILKNIATSETANNKDKIAAVKELNSMCGYNMQNHQMLVGLVDVVIE